MAKIYIIRIPKKQMSHVGDMLRYDGCYGITERDEVWEVELTGFTPERWKSFGWVPKDITSLNVRQSEWYKFADRHLGFMVGVRFAQKFYGQDGAIRLGLLVQDF